MTLKYYDTDAYQTEFDATVRACEPAKNGYAVLLDGTLFFPEEGGQKADKGTLGEQEVLDVQIKGDEIYHIVASPLSVGEQVHGKIDFATRYHKMQNHTGEHIVCGLVHSLYGFDNVGFHLGSEDVTLDLSGVLSREDLDRIEELANEVIYRNLPITARYPSADDLATMNYRAKLDLTDNVRIVTIEGVDDCACCAPHVKTTGEVGMIKLLDFLHYKGGVRIHMQCGKAALMDYRQKYASVAKCSALMSAKQNEIDLGVMRLLKQNEELNAEIRSWKRHLAEEIVASIPTVSTCFFRFETAHSMDFWRDVAMLLAKRDTATAFFLMPKDESSYAYVACSEKINLKEYVSALNQRLNGRGGGKEGMIQGSFSASEHDIKECLAEIFNH